MFIYVSLHPSFYYLSIYIFPCLSIYLSRLPNPRVNLPFLSSNHSFQHRFAKRNLQLFSATHNFRDDKITHVQILSLCTYVNMHAIRLKGCSQEYWNKEHLPFLMIFNFWKWNFSMTRSVRWMFGLWSVERSSHNFLQGRQVSHPHPYHVQVFFREFLVAVASL